MSVVVASWAGLYWVFVAFCICRSGRLVGTALGRYHVCVVVAGWKGLRVFGVAFSGRQWPDGRNCIGSLSRVSVIVAGWTGLHCVGVAFSVCRTGPLSGIALCRCLVFCQSQWPAGRNCIRQKFKESREVGDYIAVNLFILLAKYSFNVNSFYSNELYT